MWEINIENQLFGIAAAIILGAVLCVIYDIFRAHRKIFRLGIGLISAGDMLFWLISAIFTFTYFLIFTNGEISGCLLLCELLGFILCRKTLSKIFLVVFKFIFKILRTSFRKIEGVLGAFADKMLMFLKKILKILKKAVNYFKKLLKSVRLMLYTKKDNNGYHSTGNSES